MAYRVAFYHRLLTPKFREGALGTCALAVLLGAPVRTY